MGEPIEVLEQRAVPLRHTDGETERQILTPRQTAALAWQREQRACRPRLCFPCKAGA